VTSDTAEKIAFLERFKSDIRAHFDGADDEATRVRISRGMRRARSIVEDAGAMKTVTLSPPPAIGGLIVRNGDPFNFILQDYYGMSMVPTVVDMIEEAIGVLESPEYEQRPRRTLQEAVSDSAISNGIVQHKASGSPPPQTVRDPELPDKVTLSWMVRHVPISFWLWLAGIIGAAFAAGAKLGPFLN
jgi:hypothetical protein